MNNIKYLALILIFFISCSNPTEPDNFNYAPKSYSDTTSVYVQGLNKIISPLSGTDPELNDFDLSPLDYLGNVRIVGLGEATHGTKEFIQMKFRIFKFLVERYNFKIFAFEADMGESVYIDRYITNGIGNLRTLMINKMHFWTWRTEEVYTLLEWMRNYNIGKSEDQMIHYLGVDCQYFDDQPDLILEYFKQTDPTIKNHIISIMDTIKTIAKLPYNQFKNYFINMNQKQESNLIFLLQSAINEMESRKDKLTAKSSEFEYANIKQLFRNIQQAVEVYYNYERKSNSTYRDKYMAENAEWMTKLFGSNTKIALWAHNFHIGNNISSMGSILKNDLIDDYQIISFSFSEGSFQAIGVEGLNYTGLKKQTITTIPIKNSINYYLFNARYNNFILRIKDIPQDSQLYQFAYEPHKFLSIGSVYNGNPDNYYSSKRLKHFTDVIINIDFTNAAIVIPKF
ncbi:erythromycin esterase [bacterium BMS3Abin04]|nr:erythromycin esterase [bacterium BMS3Abin04]